MRISDWSSDVCSSDLLSFGLVALGVFISFRVLRFPDLTVDGSFPLGGAVAATLISMGMDPFTSTLIAAFAGAIAGMITGWLNVKLKIMDLLEIGRAHV